jgi:flagellin-like protein
MTPTRLVEAFARASTAFPDLTTDERATSPTIGAVLLVGITVVLATATGAQLFGLAGSQQGAFATATIDLSPGDDRVTVTWLANGDADSLKVRILVGDERRTVGLDGVGDRVVVDRDGITVSKGAVGDWETPSIEDGDQVSVTVIAHKGGENVVVAERSGTV